MRWNWATVRTIGWLAAWTIRLAALFVVPVNRKPSSATTWLMLIFLFPFVGLPVFLLIGSPKLSRHRRGQQHVLDEGIAHAVTYLRQQPDMAPALDLRALAPESLHEAEVMTRSIFGAVAEQQRVTVAADLLGRCTPRA
jgi:cardiolipin synthase